MLLFESNPQWARLDSNQRQADYESAGQFSQLQQSQALTESMLSVLARCLALVSQKYTLSQVIEAWPDLPGHIRQAINALITVAKTPQ